MPPGPAYNWLCVLNSTVEILSHAAQYKAAQIAPKAIGSYIHPRKRRRTEEAWGRENVTPPGGTPAPSRSTGATVGLQREHATKDLKPLGHDVLEKREASKSIEAAQTISEEPLEKHCVPAGEPWKEAGLSEIVPPVVKVDKVSPIQEEPFVKPIPEVYSPKLEHVDSPASTVDNVSPLGTTRAVLLQDHTEGRQNVDADLSRHAEVQTLNPQPMARNLQSSKVPSSRIGRLFHYGGLAASLGYGAASEVLRRTGTGSQDQSSVMMTEANIKRLVSKLSQMRGAALKLGQFMSIQDTHILPPEIDKIFRRVQDSAHYMPDWQMEEVMQAALGPSWADNFVSFDRLPFAAASIGQVHTAILSPLVSPTGKEERVAVKIQFPNIANSIESDLGYIKLLLTAGKLLPKGLFLDKTIHAMKTELADECDYVREASFLRLFGSPEFLGNDKRFKVPWVWDQSTANVLVMERVDGVSVGEANAQHLTLEDRTAISAGIIELCLKELFEFRAMQTDPNWTNFLWNAQTRQIELVDFGATRTYSKEFMDNWFTILQAATLGDRDLCIESSLKIGYLTGEENELMLDAHVNSMTLLATPFKPDTPQPFSFGQGSQWADITARIRAQIPVMLQHRLTPPPKETYSLNRKLSGSFLLASRLGASIDTRAIWDKVISKYRLGDV